MTDRESLRSAIAFTITGHKDINKGEKLLTGSFRNEGFEIVRAQPIG